MPRITVLLVAAALVAPPAPAQHRVTTPRQALGFDVGADYHLATYTQLEAYWRTLARESPRMVLREIGKTAEGRPQLMAIITSPSNHKRLARYEDIARRLALAQELTDEQAHALAREGKAAVWIDGGLHATEVLGAHQLLELVYQMVSRDDPETRRILDDVILLAVQANPDGMELVSSWYMREPDSLKRSTAGIPRLYQKYIGHDNKRDFYMVTQPETEHMARVMFREWFPQIVYNHHQTGPAGTVLFAPPFRDPFNYYFDPLVPIGIDMVAAAMHARFLAEGKPGATMRSGAPYSTWWNGGLRTTAYFHNMIGLLTEAIGNPTPIDIPFVPDRALPKGDMPAPVEPQRWHFRQSVDYSITANRAILDYASRYRETLLYNIYRMGENAIERGGADHWTVHPQLIETVKAAALKDSALDTIRTTRTRDGRVPTKYFALLHDPAQRDPRGYILPSDQADFPTATKFVNTLIKNGVTVLRATRDFDLTGRHYPAQSYVVQAAQAFRPHVLDMFEPQDHPNDFQYPGGPPIPPYDNAGWTLAYQMGVSFDRILDRFDGPFEPVRDTATPPAGTVSRADGAAGFLLSHRLNDAAIAQNDRDQPDDFFGPPPPPETIPAEFRNRLGRVSVQKTVPLLRQFLADGGTIIAIGSSTGLGQHIGLPLASHLVLDGKPLPRSKFYVPGSLLQARIDTTRAVAYGIPGRVDVFFDNSPVFDLRPDAAAAGVRPVAWFESDHPLRSGWAGGQQYLKDGVAAVEAPIGDKAGTLLLFGPEILNRGQPHGTFKLFFNAVFLARAAPAPQATVGTGSP